MEINKKPQYSIKWSETVPLLLATELQFPNNQTVMERTKSSIISGMNPKMEKKILLEADTQEEEVPQGEVLQEEAFQMGVLLTMMMTMTTNRMMTTTTTNQIMMTMMKMMRDHYCGNLPSDLLVDHLLEDNLWVLNL